MSHCSERSKPSFFAPALINDASAIPMVANATQDPHFPWSFTDVIYPKSIIVRYKLGLH